jgi:hypothetical protein
MQAKAPIVAVLFVVTVFWSVSARPAPAQQDVVDLLDAYEQAWSRRDAQAIADFYYEPAMRVGKGGPVVRATRAEQASFFAGFLPGMVERGYDHSVWEGLEVRLLDPQTAVASGITVRYRVSCSHPMPSCGGKSCPT